MNIEIQQDVGYIKSYILSRDLTFSQMSPKMLKPKEIHKFSQGNVVFNVVATFVPKKHQIDSHQQW